MTDIGTYPDIHLCIRTLLRRLSQFDSIIHHMSPFIVEEKHAGLLDVLRVENVLDIEVYGVEREKFTKKRKFIFNVKFIFILLMFKLKPKSFLETESNISSKKVPAGLLSIP